ncbi:MAG: PorV/PorQ family protein [Elusimicrobia bacterium]|nr:PorV/PorQ family protein [Elusimicrobiota bacterium]
MRPAASLVPLRFLRAAIAAGVAAWAPPAAAIEQPGVTAVPVLQVPMGTRALGMGGAFTAVASDPSALYYNPAGLSLLSAHEFDAAFLAGQADNFHQQFAYAGPVPYGGIAGEGYSSVGAGVLYSRDGAIEVNELASDGTLLRTRTINAGYDVVGAIGYAERVGSTPVDTPKQAYNFNHFVGVAGKGIYSSLAEKYSATAWAGDAGYLMQCPELGLSLGLAALNVGSRLRYTDSSDPLPTSFRLGAAYNLKPAPLHDLTVAADGDYLYYDRLWHASVGMEYFWNRNFGFRLGYQFNRQTLGITAGLGMRWKGRFSIDYAWALGNTASDTHRVTLGYRFGGVIRASRGQSRRPFVEVSPGQESLPVSQEIAPAKEPARPRPRPSPKDDRPSGVPGWIY